MYWVGVLPTFLTLFLLILKYWFKKLCGCSCVDIIKVIQCYLITLFRWWGRRWLRRTRGWWDPRLRWWCRWIRWRWGTRLRWWGTRLWWRSTRLRWFGSRRNPRLRSCTSILNMLAYTFNKYLNKLLYIYVAVCVLFPDGLKRQKRLNINWVSDIRGVHVYKTNTNTNNILLRNVFLLWIVNIGLKIL